MKMFKCRTLLRRIVFRASMLVLALILVSLIKMSPAQVNSLEPLVSHLDKCPLGLGLGSNSNQEDHIENNFGFLRRQSEENLTKTILTGLLGTNLLRPTARVLCVGVGSASAVLSMREMGFEDVVSVESHPFFSLFKRRFVYELALDDNSFDLVFSADIDRVSVPSLLAMEIERVLSPGGTGVILVRSRKFYSSGLISSFLKGSDVVHACGSGGYTVVIFKKRFNSFASFGNFRLPDDCPSVTKNKPFLKFLEPVSGKSAPSYLPKHMNISSRNKLVYISIGAGEFAKENVVQMTNTYCSNHHRGFDVYVIDYRTSVLTSYVTEPGITFIYDPSLSGSPLAPEISADDYLVDVMDEEEFEFVPWFSKTVTNEDFVVLVMNAKVAELNILSQLFRTEAICHVDELFVRCSDAAADCKSLVESLRKSAPKNLLARGQLTEKVDGYSFGVLLLEIVTGRQYHRSKSAEYTDILVTIAWQNIREGTFEELIDPNLMLYNYQNVNTKSEILPAVHVGLLCCKEIPSSRPSMSRALQLLVKKEERLPSLTCSPFLDENHGTEPGPGM